MRILATVRSWDREDLSLSFCGGVVDNVCMSAPDYMPARFEGPFTMPNGRTVYYDRTEGEYYDRSTDLYLSREETMALWN